MGVIAAVAFQTKREDELPEKAMRKFAVITGAWDEACEALAPSFPDPGTEVGRRWADAAGRYFRGGVRAAVEDLCQHGFPSFPCQASISGETAEFTIRRHLVRGIDLV
jgi:hypothetical protein